MDRGWSEQLGLMSIGHSIHEIAKFVSLLEENEVEVVADVRSVPYSRFNPQFNRENLRRSLLAHDIGYDFQGRELGGRPEGDGLYDPDRFMFSTGGWPRPPGSGPVCDGSSRQPRHPGWP